MKAVYCFNAFSNFICQNPQFKVQAGKMSSTYQTLQCLLHSRLGVGVLFHACIQMAEVNAKLQASILLPYQHNCITPCTLARPNSTRLQHLPQMISNLLNQRWGNPPKSLFKGSVICNFCHVFNRVSTAQLCMVQGKHINVFGQEPVGHICQFQCPRV